MTLRDKWRSNEADGMVDTQGTGVYMSSSVLKAKRDIKRLQTREALLSGLPTPELLENILNATSSWWHTWYAQSTNGQLL